MPILLYRIIGMNMVRQTLDDDVPIIAFFFNDYIPIFASLYVSVKFWKGRYN